MHRAGRNNGLIGQNSWLFCPICLVSSPGPRRGKYDTAYIGTDFLGGRPPAGAVPGMEQLCGILVEQSLIYPPCQREGGAADIDCRRVASGVLRAEPGG